MSVKIQILCLIVLSICYGCSTPKFYNEIISTYPEGKQDDYVMKSSIKPHKLVLRKLEKSLKNSNHIIYHYVPEATWYSKEFSGIVFDVENNKYYYFTNSRNRPRKVQVDTVYKYSNDNYYKFIIENYCQGKIDYLKKLGKISNHSGYRTSVVIYDINLKSDTIQRYTFRDFLFLDGKPLIEIEE